MLYDRTQIAKELDATAAGRAYYGNALYVARDLPELDDDDRRLLTRYIDGTRGGIDHVALQDVALKILRAV